MHKRTGWLLMLLLVFSVADVHAQDLDPNSDPTALIRFVHALPDTPSVDIYLGDEPIVEDLSLGEATDYGFTPDGEQTIFIRAGDALSDTEPLLEETADLNSGSSYTLAIAGDPEQPDAFLLTDDVGASGEAFGSLRVVNLVPGDEPLAASVDGAAITELLAYGDSSERTFADQAEPEVVIFDEGGNEVVAAPDLSLAEGEFYTLFLVPSEDDEVEVLSVLYPVLTGAVPGYQIWVPIMTQGDKATPAPETTPASEATPSPEVTSELQDVGQTLLGRVQATATAEAQATATAEAQAMAQTPPVTETEAITSTEATTSTEAITSTEATTSTSPLMPVTGAGQKDGPIPLWLVLDGFLLIVLVFVGRLWWQTRIQ